MIRMMILLNNDQNKRHTVVAARPSELILASLMDAVADLGRVFERTNLTRTATTAHNWEPCTGTGSPFGKKYARFQRWKVST